jgi:hypothetical protein
MSKKLVYLYGNCHTKVLGWMLWANPKFTEKYKLVGFKSGGRKCPTWYAPNMQIKRDLRRMITNLKDVDIFIHQKISENFRGKHFSSDYLKQHTNGRSIWLFNYFFRGYAPCYLTSEPIANLKNEKGTKRSYNFRAMLFYLFANNKSPEEAKHWLETEHSQETTDFTLKVAKDDIAELKRRQTEQVNLGNEIIGMSDVIETWQETQLGICNNHPTMHYYWILCRRLLKSLEVEVDDDETWNWKTKNFHWQNDDMIFNYVRETCPNISWPETMTTFEGSRNPNFENWGMKWGDEFLERQYKRFEENTEDFINAYKQHKINKFLPL